VLEGVGGNLYFAAPPMDSLNQTVSATFSSLVFLGRSLEILSFYLWWDFFKNKA
jgi:hypothetical protein